MLELADTPKLQAERASTRLTVASEGYGHGGPGVCLGDGQTAAHLKDMGMAGLASAWAMARWRPTEYLCKADAATRCSGVYPHTYPEGIGTSPPYVTHPLAVRDWRHRPY